jgi:hypothetical protein
MAISILCTPPTLMILVSKKARNVSGLCRGKLPPQLTPFLDGKCYLAIVATTTPRVPKEARSQIYEKES